MRRGDTVVAVKNVGGFIREYVPAGTTGIVTATHWGGTADVVFTIRSWRGEKQVLVTVRNDEIAAAA